MGWSEWLLDSAGLLLAGCVLLAVAVWWSDAGCCPGTAQSSSSASTPARSTTGRGWTLGLMAWLESAPPGADINPVV